MSAVTGPAGEGRRRSWISAETLLRPEATLIVVIVVIGAATAARNSNFLNVGNLTDILRAAVIYFVVCFSLSMLVKRLQKKIAIIR